MERKEKDKDKGNRKKKKKGKAKTGKGLIRLGGRGADGEDEVGWIWPMACCLKPMSISMSRRQPSQYFFLSFFVPCNPSSPSAVYLSS